MEFEAQDWPRSQAEWTQHVKLWNHYRLQQWNRIKDQEDANTH